MSVGWGVAVSVGCGESVGGSVGRCVGVCVGRGAAVAGLVAVGVSGPGLHADAAVIKTVTSNRLMRCPILRAFTQVLDRRPSKSPSSATASSAASAIEAPRAWPTASVTSVSAPCFSAHLDACKFQVRPVSYASSWFWEADLANASLPTGSRKAPSCASIQSISSVTDLEIIWPIAPFEGFLFTFWP